jgi:hypothetical protein
MTAQHILAKDIAAFERKKAELLNHYADKFVVFHDGEFQGSYDSFDSAARDALSRFHDTPFLIRQVGAPDVMPMPASVAFRPANAGS